MRGGWRIVLLAVAMLMSDGVAAQEEAPEKAPGEAAVRGPLDGAHFVGSIRLEDGQARQQAEFVFQQGAFRTTAFEDCHFDAPKYEAQPDGSRIEFVTDYVSEQCGRIHWQGAVVEETDLDGTAVWLRTDRTPQVEEAYRFRGTLKEAIVID